MFRFYLFRKLDGKRKTQKQLIGNIPDLFVNVNFSFRLKQITCKNVWFFRLFKLPGAKVHIVDTLITGLRLLEYRGYDTIGLVFDGSNELPLC